MNAAVWLIDNRLFDAEQPRLHCFLRRHVAAGAGLHQVAFVTEPSKEPCLPHLYAVLSEQLRKLAYENVCVRRRN